MLLEYGRAGGFFRLRESRTESPYRSGTDSYVDRSDQTDRQRSSYSKLLRKWCVERSFLLSSAHPDM